MAIGRAQKPLDPKQCLADARKFLEQAQNLPNTQANASEIQSLVDTAFSALMRYASLTPKYLHADSTPKEPVVDKKKLLKLWDRMRGRHQISIRHADVYQIKKDLFELPINRILAVQIPVFSPKAGSSPDRPKRARKQPKQDRKPKP